MKQSSNFVELKFPQIAVVEASAGSGKTYALAKRFLQLLINKSVPAADSLQTILAITFTNKAACQMKERILEILKNLALDSFSNQFQKKDIVDALGVDYRFARQRAHLLIEEIIRCYNFFQVKTIDSFINYLLLGCALHTQRSAAFTIKRNYKESLAYALDLLIDKSTSNQSLNEELNLFLRHYLFVENRAGWFPKNQILELMVSLFELANRHGREFSHYQANTEMLLKEKAIAYKRIKELSSDLDSGLNKNVRKSILNFVCQQNEYFDIASLPKSLAKVRPSLNKGAKEDKKFFDKWKKIHQQVRRVAEIEAEAAYNPYIKIFNQVSAILESFSKKEDVLFLSQLNCQARFLFGQKGLTVAEIYYRLATRLRHYLIDEFQDTSRLQWNNLKLMVEEALSSGGTFFYVGDKKQAIYRFRGGESGLFDKIKENLSYYRPTLLQLTKNWRSQKQIVEFNNFLFSSQNLSRFIKNSKISQELKRKDHLTKIADNFSDSTQSWRKENCFGYVYVEKLNEDNQNQRNEIVKEKLAKLICDLRKRFNLSDIALLTRDNQEVELLTNWLLKEGIPSESEKTLNVLEHPQIKEIISFLKFLYSPIDDLSFASFVLGEIFQKKSGLNKEEIKDFLFCLSHQKDKKKVSLYRQFAICFPGVWEKLVAPFFKTVGFVSCYELLVAIYRCYEVSAKFSYLQAFFKKFLQLCDDSQEEKAGLWGFLSYLENPDPEKLYLDVAAADAIKILTIHKAKGLEFPVVVIPFLRMDISAETGTKQTKSYLEYCRKANLRLLRITKEQKKYSQRLADIYQENFKQGCIDELNNVYVALTRPKNELYAFIPRKSGNSINQASFLIEEEKIERGEKNKYFSLSLQPKIKKIGASLYKEWSSHLNEEFSEGGAKKERSKLREGTLFHQALAYLGDCTQADLDESISLAVKEVEAKFAIQDPSFYRNKLKEIITHKNLKDLFFQPEATIFCEREFVDKNGNTKRVDRLLVFKDRVLIIDYKLAYLFSEDIHFQLRKYKEIIADLYPGKEIEAAVVYLDQLRKEFIY